MSTVANRRTDGAEDRLGLALLIDGDHASALPALRHTLTAMRRGGRTALVPAVAVYLAEAAWRAGDEEAADRAADAALAAAEAQGSIQVMLAALADFPAVAWRRLDAEEGADSAWHWLARTLRANSPGVVMPSVAVGPHVVEVREFGAQELLIDGVSVRPRLTKAHTLLALLAADSTQRLSRAGAIAALFECGTRASTTAYLRLAVRSAREILPQGLTLALERDVIALTPAGSLTSESARFEAQLTDARGRVALDRLGGLLAALEVYRVGPYLRDDSSPWGEQRRRDLDDAAEDALIEAAGAAHDLGEYSQADALVGDALARNRYRESAWRLKMRIAAATRDHDGVIAAFRGCQRAVGDLGAEPSQATTALLARLRM